MSNKEPIWKEPLLIAIGAGAVARWLGADQRFSILAGIAVFIYAVYLGSVYSENGKQAAAEKLKEHFVVGGGTVAVFAVSILLTKTLSRWIGLTSAAAKLFIWLVIIVVIPLLIVLILFPKRKK